MTGAGAGELIQPCLIRYYRQSNARSIDKPLPTITAENEHIGVCQPYLIKLYGTSDGQSIDEPLPSITAQGQHVGVGLPIHRRKPRIGIRAKPSQGG
ncbi:MAG: hypothetical protein ACREDR_06430 [Blastocatellia bacterium]